jgi:hypothetical protein
MALFIGEPALKAQKNVKTCNRLMSPIIVERGM